MGGGGEGEGGGGDGGGGQDGGGEGGEGCDGGIGGADGERPTQGQKGCTGWPFDIGQLLYVLEHENTECELRNLQYPAAVMYMPFV